MPKNRHLSFGDMQAQKAREERLAKLRVIMKPAQEAEPVAAQPATPTESAKPVTAPVAAKATKPKSAAKKVPAKKAAAKKKAGKK